MTNAKTFCATFLLSLIATAAHAEGISTHVLDVANGTGGGGVPVTLEREGDNGWSEVATATTADNGRVDALVEGEAETGLYRLTFDMTDYEGFADTDPLFFPQITVTFQVDDGSQHYHVPVVVSPFSYSTYRGN